MVDVSIVNGIINQQTSLGGHHLVQIQIFAGGVEHGPSKGYLVGGFNLFSIIYGMSSETH